MYKRILLAILLYLKYIRCKENAVILILCRNSDLNDIQKTIENFENRFNNKFKYPYVFLNDNNFTENFKITMTNTCKNRVKFGKVSPEIWNMPNNIKKSMVEKNWEKMKKEGVPYADMESYHNMCRFFSKSFYKHDLVKEYDYYWRVEPGVSFNCDIVEDPFEFIRKNNIDYGFVIAMNEYMNSIPTLFEHTVDFLIQNRNLIKNQNNLRFMFENGKYNGCHFWSNFEIASFKFFRSDIYNRYVDYLDKKEGFYYERWGDAPVHSLAASFFLDRSNIYYFENIGYTHSGITHCPKNGNNCDCNLSDSIDVRNPTCITKYLSEK